MKQNLITKTAYRRGEVDQISMLKNSQNKIQHTEPTEPTGTVQQTK
jgi:hypothetical protein